MATQIASAKKLIINKLTQAQYDSIVEKDPAQLYLITDAEISSGSSEITSNSSDVVFDLIAQKPDGEGDFGGIRYKLPNNLPIGEYEFFFKTYGMPDISNGNNVFFSEKNFKIRLFKESDTGYSAIVIPLEGSFFSGNRNINRASCGRIVITESGDVYFAIGDSYEMSCEFAAYPNNNDAIFEKPWFSVSKLRNVNTGNEYSFESQTHTSLWNFADGLVDNIASMTEIVRPEVVYIPEKLDYFHGNAGSALAGQYAMFSSNDTKPNDVFYVKIYDLTNLDNQVLGLEIDLTNKTYQILSGEDFFDLSLLEVVSSDSESQTFAIKLPSDFESPMMMVSSKYMGMCDINFHGFRQDSDLYATPVKFKRVPNTFLSQVLEMPVVSTDNLNKIYQYVGETTSDYVNGHFYKAYGDTIEIPEVCEINQISYTTSYVLSFAEGKEQDFISWFKNYLDTSSLTADDFSGEFTYRCKADGTVNICYPGPYTNIADDELLSCFVVDNKTSKQAYFFKFKINYTPAFQEIENGRWEQVNVQPVDALINTHNTSLSAHENIRGIANGLATLDNNAKVPMSQINDSLLGNVQYQGLYDVSTNTPNLDTVETKGHYYIVSVAGDRFDISFEIGDWIISDGTNWTKVDNTDAVSSVNGRTGNVVITTEDLDLSNYVQKTDYASSKAAGLIRGYNANGFGFVPDTGYPFCEAKSLASYNVAGGNLFIGKGTLESIKYSYVRDGIANNTYSLSNTEKEKVRNWIGAGVPTTFETMPDIYASAGKTYQYVGETTEEFTSGYFYKSVSQGISYIPSDSNLTFDFDLFWSELESAGITLETLQMTEMDKERGGFSIIGTVESETTYRVQDINGVQLDVLLTQSIQSTSEYVGTNNRWYYKPSETFAWERVDVQPESTQYTELPEATANNLGKIVQYTGNTTEDYNNGYFYKSSGLPNLTVESYTGGMWDVIEVEVSDVDLFVKTFGNVLGTYVLRVDSSSSWTMEKPDGTTYNATAPIDYGLNITINGDLQTTLITNASNTTEIVLDYSSDGFVWKQINTQPNTNMNIPAHPTTPGSYMLMCTVGEDGTVSYSWETVA